jgi:hypothetical protein
MNQQLLGLSLVVTTLILTAACGRPEDIASSANTPTVSLTSGFKALKISPPVKAPKPSPKPVPLKPCDRYPHANCANNPFYDGPGGIENPLGR